jgi:hypothetical protein
MEEISYKQDSLGSLSAPSPRVAWNTVLAVVSATALVAICAHIAVPLGFTPVPVTMQTFAVLLLGLLFGPGPAFACLALYLMEGAVGLPVFSPHGPGGLAQMLGHRRLPALLSLCGRSGECALSARTTLLRGCDRVFRTRKRPHSCRRRQLARAAHPRETFCCLRSVGRTVSPRRCGQNPRSSGLCKHAWIVRQ